MRRAVGVAALVADEAEVVVGLGVVDVLGGGLLDEGGGLVEVADLVVGAAHQEGVVGVVVGARGDAGDDARGLLAVALAEERVELEEEGVDDLLVDLGEIERLVAHLDGLVEVPQGVDVDLGRVEHRLQVGVVEGDGLAVRLDRLLPLALEGGDEAEEVVRLGRVGVELQRTSGGGVRPARVAALHEVPPSVEVRGELIHVGDMECAKRRPKSRGAAARTGSLDRARAGQ